MQILALKIVLVATDLSEGSLPAISAAHTIARAAGALMHVVHVGDEPDGGGATHAQLGRLGIPLDEASVHTLPGEPAPGVVRLANEIRADVIIVGSHGRRHGRSTDAQPEIGTALVIATRAPVPVLVVGRDARIPVGRVMVAVDRSETARGAAVISLSWASALRESKLSAVGGTKLIVVYVDVTPAGPERHAVLTQEVERRIAKLRIDAGVWAGVGIEHVVLEGKDVAGTITKYVMQNDIDLVVLGTRGVGLDRERRLGSVSARVCEGVTKPVLLVPPAVWQAYIQSDTPTDLPAETA